MKQPTKGPLAVLSEEEFSMFICQLGYLVFNTPSAAAFARHKGPLNTVADYLDIYKTDEPYVRLAKEYWRDLAYASRRQGNTEKLVEKWFLATTLELGNEVSAALASIRTEGQSS